MYATCLCIKKLNYFLILFTQHYFKFYSNLEKVIYISKLEKINPY